MRLPVSVRTGLTAAVLPFVLAACGSDQPDARASAAAPAGTPAQAAAAPGEPSNAELPVVYVYKTPTCGCCADWVTHIEQAGFRAEVQDLNDLRMIKERAGVPHQLESCHTSLVGDYVVEGHVPASTMRRMLLERPAIAGIAVPGMPMGSPGMEGPWKDRYDVIAFTRDGRGMVYESH
jgi:hypothetical protein